MNFTLVKDTLLGNYPLNYKFSIMRDLLGSLWTAMPLLNVFLLFTIAILTGLNLILIVNQLYKFRENGKIELFAGGGMLFGVIGAGCATCGLPVLSLIGLGGSIAYLPFKGGEIPYISLVLLLTSFIFLLYRRKNECVVQPVSKIYRN